MRNKPQWMTPEDYARSMELFMAAVARELKCLPSYADPMPDGGNAHIIRKLRELIANTGIERPMKPQRED